MSETNIKIVKIAILSSPIFVIWASDLLLHIPISILINVIIPYSPPTWFPVTIILLTPIKIAISAIAVYYTMKQWNKYFPPVKYENEN